MTISDFESCVLKMACSLGVDQGERVAVAFSGGSDSVALLNSMHSLGYDCVALHCNFNLRGSESERDELFCVKMAERLGIEIRVTRFDTLSEKRAGESLEMVCRRLRYSWFGQQKKELGIRYLLTGHHRDDSAETMFLNLFRGTGMRGISGIKPFSDSRLSPMCRLSRTEIIDYLRQKGLEYVTDSSNLETKYNRNKIRNKIMPLIRSEFPEADKGIATTMHNLSDAAALIGDFVRERKTRYFRNNSINLRELLDNEAHPEILLFYLLEPYGFNRTQTDCMAASVHNSGAVFQSGNYRVVASRGILEISDRLQHNNLYEVDVREIRKENISEFSRDHKTLYMDADKIKGGCVWELRNWRYGDRIAPFGMSGKTRLVSDILSDAKLSVIDKERQQILTLDGEVVWVYGIKETDRYRIDSDTSRVLVVTLRDVHSGQHQDVAL